VVTVDESQMEVLPFAAFEMQPQAVKERLRNGMENYAVLQERCEVSNLIPPLQGLSCKDKWRLAQGLEEREFHAGSRIVPKGKHVFFFMLDGEAEEEPPWDAIERSQVQLSLPGPGRSEAGSLDGTHEDGAPEEDAEEDTEEDAEEEHDVEGSLRGTSEDEDAAGLEAASEGMDAAEDLEVLCEEEAGSTSEGVSPVKTFGRGQCMGELKLDLATERIPKAARRQSAVYHNQGLMDQQGAVHDVVAVTNCRALELTAASYYKLSEATQQQLLLCMPRYRALQQRRELLGNINLFQQLGAEDRWILATIMSTVVLNTGEIFVEPGKRVDQIYIIERGQLTVEQQPAENTASSHSADSPESVQLEGPLHLWTRELVEQGLWDVTISVTNNTEPVEIHQVPTDALTVLSAEAVQVVVAQHMPLLGYEASITQKMINVNARGAANAPETTPRGSQSSGFKSPAGGVAHYAHFPVVDLGQKSHSFDSTFD